MERRTRLLLAATMVSLALAIGTAAVLTWVLVSPRRWFPDTYTQIDNLSAQLDDTSARLDDLETGSGDEAGASVSDLSGQLDDVSSKLDNLCSVFSDYDGSFDGDLSSFVSDLDGSC
jgi:hypothetical protein